MLVGMDGFETNVGVSCRRDQSPDILDAYLLRPGRLTDRCMSRCLISVAGAIVHMRKGSVGGQDVSALVVIARGTWHVWR
jgi:hypothetical protein